MKGVAVLRYQTAQEWLDAVREDQVWLTCRAQMETAFAENPVMAQETFLAKAWHRVGDGIVNDYWDIMHPDIDAVVKEVWDSCEETLARLKMSVIGMLMLNWISERTGTKNEEMTVHGQGSDELPELCILLPMPEQRLLAAAAAEGLIIYNSTRKGYDVCPSTSTNVLVAYLCGRMFCRDYTDGVMWMRGGNFYKKDTCLRLFGFDVGNSRKSAIGQAGKSPVGHERVDKLFDRR